jgi:translation initiation factor 1
MRLFEGTPFDRPPRCDRCGELEAACRCPPPAAAPLRAPSSQTATLAVEKRKKGKVVTVIRGLRADQNDLPALLVRLKSQCGAGGSLNGDAVEIQGNQLDRIRAMLTALGYRTKG